MTITIPTPISPAPSVRRPTVKRFAMAGAAVIAIAAAAVGVTTMLDDDPAPTATTTSSSVTNTSDLQASYSLDPGQNPVSAYTGLIPTEPAVSAQLDQFAATNGLSGLSPASLGPATTAAVPEAPRVTAADVGSVEWLQANGWLPATATDDVANEVVPRTNFASDLDWLVANGFVPSGPR